jgi:hypothetical protein
MTKAQQSQKSQDFNDIDEDEAYARERGRGVYYDQEAK